MATAQPANPAPHGVRALLNVATAPYTKSRDLEDIRKVNWALLPLLFLAFAAALWIGVQAGSVGAIFLWSVACVASGATVGFLFGIPRAGPVERLAAATAATGPAGAQGPAGAAASALPRSTGRPNTNLEEVSDWLTKIIVGLGLVHLKEIGEHVQFIGRLAAAALRPTPTESDVSTATALVVAFAVLGFLLSYLYTRLFLQGAFSRSDQSFAQALAQELADAPPPAPPPSGEPVVPSNADREAAERLRQVAPANQPDAVLAPLRALAADYERVRVELPFGAERTRRMASIAGAMRRLALAAAPYLAQLARSSSPGERLAAISILQMQFDPVYIEWLANRLVEEAAFPGYQAASTLLARLSVVGGAERQQIKSAVQSAMDRRAELKLEPEAERDALAQKILAS